MSQCFVARVKTFARLAVRAIRESMILIKKKIPEIGEDRCSTRINGLRIDIIRTTFLASAAEILFKIIPTEAVYARGSKCLGTCRDMT